MYRELSTDTSCFDDGIEGGELAMVDEYDHS